MADVYRRCRTRFWTGSTGRWLRTQPASVSVLAHYLITCNSSNMIGLYYLPEQLIAIETCLSSEEASKALRSLVDHGFCLYDAVTQTVWVVNGGREQLGDVLKPKDNRHKKVVSILNQYKDSPLAARFRCHYADAWCLPCESSSAVASKPLRSQDQDQDQDQDQERERSARVQARRKPSSTSPPHRTGSLPLTASELKSMTSPVSKLDIADRRRIADCLWQFQNSRRRDVDPSQPDPPAPVFGAGSRDAVLELLNAGRAPSELVHVVEVYAAEAEACRLAGSKAPLKFFDGRSNWKPENVLSALAKTPEAAAAQVEERHRQHHRRPEPGQRTAAERARQKRELEERLRESDEAFRAQRGSAARDGGSI